MVANTETSIFQRMIGPQEPDLTPETARFMLALDFADQDRRRMSELSARAASGNVTADELRELDSYIHVSDLLALMQSKARLSLQKQGGNPGTR